MSVQCQILINKAREGVHRAGHPVTGIVKYKVNEPSEYKDVTLSFLGKGKCQWSESNSDKSDDDYYGTENYIVNVINICNKKSDELIKLHGEYEYPFEFFLPEDIPRSFKDRTASITYTIELKFVKPALFSFNKVFTAEIPVYNYVTAKSPGPVIFGLDKKLMTMFYADPPVVNLKAEINKTCFAPGENANITYEVFNNTDSKICLRTELICYMLYTANCGRTRRWQYTVKPCERETASIAERSKCEHLCTLPLPDLYSIENSKIIRKEYKVKVTVRLPMPYTNATVEMPVVLGEQRGSVDPAVEAIQDNQEPPSYWEAMCEEKKEKTN